MFRSLEIKKRQKDSRIPRRWREVRIPLEIGEAFGVRLSFLALFWGSASEIEKVRYLFNT